MTDMQIFADAKFGDPDAMKDFLFANSLAHHDVAAILMQRGQSIDSKPLTDMGNVQDWLQVHADIHQQELAYLGISDAPNIGEVDLTVESEYINWMQEHALLHLYVQQALGLS
jgi:hypothetical protein